MREIDMFENRLQLKTLQEGLKHKVASVDITPKLVYGTSILTPLDSIHPTRGSCAEMREALCAFRRVHAGLCESERAEFYLPTACAGKLQTRHVSCLPIAAF